MRQTNEHNDKDEECALFGDGWNSRFQYEDSEGTIVGCYIEKAYINKIVQMLEKHMEEEVQAFLESEE